MKVDKQKLKLAQAKALMTNAELASAANISINTLTKICRSDVQALTLGKIAQALNVEAEELIATNIN